MHSPEAKEKKIDFKIFILFNIHNPIQFDLKSMNHTSRFQILLILNAATEMENKSWLKRWMNSDL